MFKISVKALLAAVTSEFKNFKIYIFLLMLLGGLSACQPRDVDPSKGVVPIVSDFSKIDSPSKPFNFSADYIEVKDRPGQKLSTCKGGAWSYEGIYDRDRKEAVYQAIYKGERMAFLKKPSNCHKVGTKIKLESSDKKDDNFYGYAVITKLMRIARKDLSDEMLKVMDHSSTSISGVLSDGTEASIAVFKYVKGSAPKEDYFLNAEVAEPAPAESGSGNIGNLVDSSESLDSPSKDVLVEGSLEAQTEVGKQLSLCDGSKWDEVRIYDKHEKAQVYKSIYEGQRAAVLAGAMNCHTVGMQVRLASQEEKGGNYGEAIVTGLYLIKKADISDDLLVDVDFERSILENSFAVGEDTVSILTFKYIKGSAPKEAEYLNGTSLSSGNSASEPATKPENGSATNTNGTNDNENNSPRGENSNSNVVTVPNGSGGVSIHIGENNTGNVTIIIGGDDGSANVIPPEVEEAEPQTSSVSTYTQEVEALRQDVSVVDYSNRDVLLKSCSAKQPWTNYRHYQKMEKQLYSGRRVARITKGDFNCYQPMDVLDIKYKDNPSKGQVRIKEVFVMKAGDLTNDLIQLTAQSPTDLKAYLGDSELINVTVFEFVEGSYDYKEEVETETPEINTPMQVDHDVVFRPGQVLKNCTENTKPFDFEITFEERDLFLNGLHKKVFVLEKAPCLEVGQEVPLTYKDDHKPANLPSVRLIRMEQKALKNIPAEILKLTDYKDLNTLKSDLEILWKKKLDSETKVTLVFVSSH